MKKLLLLVAISILSFSEVKAQLNPVKNLNYGVAYNYQTYTGCPGYNCFKLTWSKPDTSTVDTLIGYKIYQSSILYQFVIDTIYGCPYINQCSSSSFNWFNNNSAFWITVKAVYNKTDSINSLANDSIFVGGEVTSINKLIKERNFFIFPNPFSTQTTLQFNEVLTDAMLSIYNVVGQQIKQLKNINGQTVTIQRDNLPSGLYFVNLLQDNKIIASSKLVVVD